MSYPLEIRGYQNNNEQVLNEFVELIKKNPSKVYLSNFSVPIAKNVPWEQLSRVTQLTCYNMPGELFDQLAKITSLQQLSLTLGGLENEYSPQNYNHFSSLTQLQSLEVPRATHEIINALCRSLPQLETIKISRFQENNVLKDLPKFTSLTSLEFTSWEKRSLQYLPQCTRLQILNISNSYCLAKEDLTILPRMSQLKILVAQHVFITLDGGKLKGPDNLFEMAGKLTNLRVLDLGRNSNARDKHLLHLVHLTGLQCLNLDFNCKLTEVGFGLLNHIDSSGSIKHSRQSL